MVDRIQESITRVSARAPVRIDFAGGWSDVPTFAEREGGTVVNAAVSLYTRVGIELGGERIRLIARDLDRRLIIPDATGIFYNGELDLHKAALNMLPVGGGIEISTRSDVPAGSGLGGSGSLDVCLLAALAAVREEHGYDAEDFAEMGFLLETSELSLLGGRQDQLAAAYGGVNVFHFSDGPVVRHPIDLDATGADELRACTTIVYTGESRFSSATHDTVWGAYASREDGIGDAIAGMRDAAARATTALRAGDWEGLAAAVDVNWTCQQQLSPDISTPQIQAIENAVRSAGAWGFKATGAGAGGCVVVLGPSGRREVIEAAAREARGEVLEWTFDFEGVQVSAA